MEKRNYVPNSEVLERVYGECERSGERFLKLSECFREKFGEREVEFFSAPGRTEIVGNHTDHNGGKILAASIDMDTIGAAAVNGTDRIRIISEGYEGVIAVDISDMSWVKKGTGTVALVAGMVEAVREFGFAVGGFDAYVATEVIGAAGVSSSASFEMLFCAIVNTFFNEGKMEYGDYARIGQYAENHFWLKSSGLMDQMACAVGGAILLDFAEGIGCEKMDFSFEKLGYDMVIVNTGKGHGDLSGEYSAVPAEMKLVAKELGVERLCESTLEELLIRLPKIAEKVDNDRAILRALHYYEENRRVEAAAEAIQNGEGKELLRLIEASGNSSWKWLQNCMSRSNDRDQKVALILALTELFIGEKKDGVCRVHGGGFAGVILAVIPKKYTAEYVDYISGFVGRENVYPMNIRQTGAVHLSR